MKDIGIVIPFLNEEGSLKLIVDSLLQHLSSNNVSYSIILVNDGSNDRSGQIADEIVSRNDNIKAIHLKTSHGIGHAYSLGLENTDTYFFSWLPSDGEIDPIVILNCLKEAQIDSNPCITFPIESFGKRSLYRNILSIIFQKFNKFLFKLDIKYFNGVGVYPSSELKKLKLKSSGFTINLEIIVKHNRLFKKRFHQVPFILKPRISGQEKALKFNNLIDVIKMILQIYRDK